MEPLKQTAWQKIANKTKRFLRDDKGIGLYFASLGIVIVAGAGLLFLLQPQPLAGPGNNFARPSLPPPKFYSPLTGREVGDEAATKQQVTAVIIENNLQSRPQSGLKDSGVIFEAIAEGGITRFAVLYQEQKPGLVGPVRSLRPYYVEWIAPFDASVAHVGGSANALAEIRNGNYKDIDQFFNGSSYWRATDRYAPHNVYTNFELLDALNQSKGFTSSTFQGFPRVDPKARTNAEETITASHIDIPISYGEFNVRYEYGTTEKAYNRFQGGQPHVDREAGQIAPKVVVVIKVPTHLGFEDGYREQMDTSGENKAYIFQNGTVVEGVWRKIDRSSQIEFLTQDGTAIPLERGQTWITAVPTDRSITWQ